MQQGDAIQISDTVMSAFLMMMSSNEQSSEVQEDALMAVGTLSGYHGNVLSWQRDHFSVNLVCTLAHVIKPGI